MTAPRYYYDSEGGRHVARDPQRTERIQSVTTWASLLDPTRLAALEAVGEALYDELIHDRVLADPELAPMAHRWRPLTVLPILVGLIPELRGEAGDR